jgi:GAF domain-containing protein
MDPTTEGTPLVGPADSTAPPDLAELARIARLCAAAVQLLRVDGASVALRSTHGQGGPVHATDVTAAVLDEWQLTLGEGPGLDAFADGVPVFVDDLGESTARRWPAFADAALAIGVSAVVVVPLRIGVIQLGLLTLYRAEPGPLDAAELGEALRMADLIAYAVLDLVANLFPERETGDGAAADDEPRSFWRAEVHQASGMVMVQLGVSIEEAMARLRAYAYAAGRPMSDVARDVVSRTLRFDEDNGSQDDDNQP